jgi:hypothetical protein
MGPCGYGKKEGDMLVELQRENASSDYALVCWCVLQCSESMSRGIQETDDWMLEWDGGGNSTASDTRSCCRHFSPRTQGSYHCNENMRTDTIAPTGQHPEDAQDLLQGQGLQEAHPAQGHPVQGWQGSSTAASRPRPERILTWHPKRLPSSLRVSVVTTVSSPVTVVRPSLSSTRRPRPPRRSSSD